MYLIIIVDLLGLSLSAVALVTAFAQKGSKTILQFIALGFSILPLLIGAAGYYLSTVQVMEAVVHADPSEKQILLELGLKYAAIPLKFGGGSTCLFVLITGFALTIARSRREEID